MRIVKRFVAACSILALATMPSAASAAWKRAQSPNFVVYGEGSEKALRDAALDLERFHALLRQRFNVVAEDESRHPLPIFLLGRADEVGTLARWSSVAGFYSSSVGDTFAVSNRERGNGQFSYDAQSVLFHEYAHHFMMRYFPAAYPAWYVEGFAEFLSTVEFRPDGRPDVGRPAYHRAYGLIDGPAMSIRDVLFKQPRQFRGDLVDVYYGRAWLLVHMLSNVPERSGQLTRYLNAIVAGTPQEAAAEQAFGDLDVLGRDLNRYRSQGLRYLRYANPVGSDIPVTITTLPAADDALVMPRLRRLSLIDAEDWGPNRADRIDDVDGDEKSDDDARAKARAARDKAIAALEAELTALSARWPQSADVLVELAIVQRARKNAAAAAQTVDRAIALQPDHGRARLLKGELLLVAAAESDNPTAAQWRDARAEIVRANRQAPNDPLPLLSYRRSFEMQGVEPPASALDGLLRAFELAPESRELRGRAAYQLAQQKRYAAAINVAKSLASDPHDRGAGAELLKQVSRMARAGGYTGPGMAPDTDESAEPEPTSDAKPAPAGAP